MKNTIYGSEIKIAFANITELKEDLDQIFSEFRTYWDQVSTEEQAVIENFEKRYNSDLIKYKWETHNWTGLSNSYKTIVKALDFDTDKALEGVRNWFDMDEVNEGEKNDIQRRKGFIVACAQFKQKIEAFKSELLEALSQAQAKAAAQIAAPKQTNVVRQKNTSFLNRIKNTIVTVCRTVKRVVVDTVKTLKDKIMATIAAVKAQVATLTA